MTRLEYDDDEYRLTGGIDDNPQNFLDRLRAWAADERRQALIPPRLLPWAERLVVPKARGQRRLPPIVLAAFVHEYAAIEESRGKLLAGRYNVSESTIREWKHKAHNRGLGDADGRPTDVAERLLASDQRTADEIIHDWLNRDQ